MKNGIRILGMNIPVPQSWDELHDGQRVQLAELLFSHIHERMLRVRILPVLFDLKRRKFLRWWFMYFVSSEALHEMLPFADFVFQETRFLHTPSGVFYRSEQMSFIEFIRLDETLRKLAETNNSALVDSILAVFYRPVDEGQKKGNKPEKFTDTDLPERIEMFEKLDFRLKKSILEHISRQYTRILENYPVIFKKAQNNSAETSGTWFHILRMIAGNATKFDEVAHLPLSAVFFDLSETVLDNERMEAKLNENKK